MFRKTLTIFSLIGLLLSVGLWGVSYWNWEYTDSTTEVALWGGTVVYRQYDAPPEKDAGWRCFGWISWPQTPRWLRRGSALTYDWVAVPLWMPTALFGLLFYGLKLIRLMRNYHHEIHDRCRVCGCAVPDSLLCCRKCQTPVSMMTVLRGALSQTFLHMLVLTMGLTAASYWHYSCTINGSTTIALSKGSFICSWGPISAKPGKRLAGYTSMKTNWVPRLNFSPFTGPNLTPVPGAPWNTTMTVSFTTQGVTYYVLPDGSVTTTLPPDVPVVPLSALSAMSGSASQLITLPVAPVAPPLTPLGPTPVAGVSTLIVPFWIPLGLIGFVIWRLRFAPANLLRQRKKLGLCLSCGYDLRASKERCPECGTPCDEKQRERMESSAGVEGAVSGVRIDSGVTEEQL